MRILRGKARKLLRDLLFPRLHVCLREPLGAAAVAFQQHTGDGIFLRDIIEQEVEILRGAQDAVQQQHSGIGTFRRAEDVVISAVHRKNSTFPHCLQ